MPRPLLDLAESGANETEIQRSLAHGSPRQARVYTKKMNERNGGGGDDVARRNEAADQAVEA
ncbi:MULTISPECIES: hypothetical protein [unclassified Sinorhizobium]|uniref:hypothetical protein n=1 Tax=unclassified Sinorhizobium TaxID=2613772 RepID=UPI0024C36655|nr:MULTISPECIES: hypothetical protein [unclassified Sinorhizobium]MDK1376590.1 hypothetical protein [Sinorhizobium sp. 6-70]MDK1483205.1 hypothetical protein [Sinorhizobium sp. 6-117]